MSRSHLQAVSFTDDSLTGHICTDSPTRVQNDIDVSVYVSWRSAKIGARQVPADDIFQLTERHVMTERTASHS